MPITPEPRVEQVPGADPAHALGAAPRTRTGQAVILPWRPRSVETPHGAADRPLRAPGDRIGTARGLLLGLALGVLLWTVILVAVWRLLR
jgi:hypothetical protein